MKRKKFKVILIAGLIRNFVLQHSRLLGSIPTHMQIQPTPIIAAMMLQILSWPTQLSKSLISFIPLIISFKLPSDMYYHKGDHLVIFPENYPEFVLRVASLLNEHGLGQVVTATTVDSNDDKPLRRLPFGVPTKVSDLLGRHVDLQVPITASFVNAAVVSAVDSEQAKILKEISELICDGIMGDWKQLRPVQILFAFLRFRMSLEKVLATVARVKKIYYSISSSSVASQAGPQIASVTVGLVNGTTTTNSTTLAVVYLLDILQRFDGQFT